MKDQLRKRGYRWNDGTDGRPKSWWVEVEEDAFDTELLFLRREVYRREVEPCTQGITACERFRAAGCAALAIAPSCLAKVEAW